MRLSQQLILFVLAAAVAPLSLAGFWLLHQAEVDRLLASEDLTRAAILIYANKQDLKDAMDADELTQSLGLQSVRTHPYHVQASCSLTGEGLYDGLNWLVAHLTAAGSA